MHLSLFTFAQPAPENAVYMPRTTES